MHVHMRQRMLQLKKIAVRYTHVRSLLFCVRYPRESTTQCVYNVHLRLTLPHAQKTNKQILQYMCIFFLTFFDVIASYSFSCTTLVFLLPV